jgi:hypothetical protein
MDNEKEKRIDASLAKQLRTSMELNAKLKNDMSVFERETWNAAIEAAAQLANDNAEGCTQEIKTIIRSLKK